MKVWRCEECIIKDGAPPCFILFPDYDKPYYCVYPVEGRMVGVNTPWKECSWGEMESFRGESPND